MDIEDINKGGIQPRGKTTMAVKRLLLLVIAMINCSLIDCQKSHHVTFEASSVSKKTLLFENEETVIKCMHDENETINISQHMGQEPADLIVENSTVMAQFITKFDLQYFNRTCTSLIMLQPQKRFSGFELECIGRTSLKHSSVVILVIDFPYCNFSLPLPTFFNNQSRRSLRIQLITTTKAVIKGMNNTQNLDLGYTTKRKNETHIIAEFLSEISRTWINAIFFFEISGTNDSRASVRRVCSYGPIQFLDSLQATVKNTDDHVQQVYEEGDTVNLTCESNVKGATKRWTVLHIPKEVNFNNYSMGDSLHIEILNIECTSSAYLNISVQCQVSFQGEEDESQFTANVTVVSCTSSWLSYIIIAGTLLCVVIVSVFIYCIRRNLREAFTEISKKYLGTKPKIKTQKKARVEGRLTRIGY